MRQGSPAGSSAPRRRRGWAVGAPVAIAGSDRIAYPAGDRRRGEVRENAALAPETIFHRSGAVFTSRKRVPAETATAESVAATSLVHMVESQSGLSIPRPGLFSSFEFVPQNNASLWIPCIYHAVLNAVQWNIPPMFPTDSSGCTPAVFNVRNGLVYKGPAAELIWSHHAESRCVPSPGSGAQHWKISFKNMSSGAVSWTADQEDFCRNSYVWPFFTAPNQPQSTVWVIPSEESVAEKAVVVDAWGATVSVPSPPYFRGQLDEIDISPALLSLVDLSRNAVSNISAAHQSPKRDGLCPAVAVDRNAGPAEALRSDKTGAGVSSTSSWQAAGRKAAVPSLIWSEFSALLTFCNAYLLVPPTAIKARKGDACHLSWEEALEHHLSLVAAVVIILEPSHEAHRSIAQLPLQPLYKSEDRMKNPSSSADVAISHKEKWRCSCGTGKSDLWSIPNALSLVLCGSCSWDPSVTNGLILSLKGILFKACSPNSAVPSSAGLKSGGALFSLLQECLDLYSKRSTPQQRLIASRIISFFSDADGKDAPILADVRSAFCEGMTYVCESETICDAVGASQSVHTKNRLQNWQDDTIASILLLTKRLLTAESNCISSFVADDGFINNSCCDLLSASESMGLLGPLISIFNTNSLLLCCTQSQTSWTEISRDSIRQNIEAIANNLACGRARSTRLVEVSQQNPAVLSPPLVDKIKNFNAVKGDNCRQSQVSKERPKRKSSCTDISPILGTQSKFSGPPLDVDNRFLLSVDLMTLLSLQHIRQSVFDSAEAKLYERESFDVWQSNCGLAVAFFLHSFVPRDWMTVATSGSERSSAFCTILPAIADTVTNRLKLIDTELACKKDMVASIIRMLWLNICISICRESSMHCPFMQNLCDEGVLDCNCAAKCKCFVGNSCSIARLYTLCAVCLSLSESNRTSSTAEIDRMKPQSGYLIKVLALQIHAIHACWKSLEQNIYNFCQNLVDWPIDVFMHIVASTNILSMCLENTLLHRASYDGFTEDVANKVLSALESLVEDIIIAECNIKNSIAIASTNEILTGGNNRTFALYACLERYPFEASKKHLIDILSMCYDDKWHIL